MPGLVASSFRPGVAFRTLSGFPLPTFSPLQLPVAEKIPLSLDGKPDGSQRESIPVGMRAPYYPNANRERPDSRGAPDRTRVQTVTRKLTVARADAVFGSTATDRYVPGTIKRVAPALNAESVVGRPCWQAMAAVDEDER